MIMSSRTEKTIAVIGATGQQGGAVLRALQADNQFKTRALTRRPSAHSDLADEVVEADLDRPETLKSALSGAHGLFLVTNFWQEGTDEIKQATTAIDVAREVGLEHLIWSTLPDVEAISAGRFSVPHYTAKAKVDHLVRSAGFAHHTFVVPPFYYQNLLTVMAPQQRPDGSYGWTLPLNPDSRSIHMGDINEFGGIVAGAFARPDVAGNGQYLPLVGDLMSFNQIIETLRQLGHEFTFDRAPRGVFPAEVEATFDYFETHTYMGTLTAAEVELATLVSGKQPTKLLPWAREHFRHQTN
ncbi:NmrA/HSCARG family protein [Rhizobium sp. 57MFTsu3.2]|uniref:NmrA/HSCARG family protein n=1 Tax=Rhizobium sp. 57MFTsu3.2 TaxID=1048681 RepID=UPI0032B18B01